ncbi:hypothetical protein MNV49_006555 [Pseudohyphozyma bogoriensis]|nr:hypothetical protein MNV49_006555 [Pseudohyphozyma bogoriensis]
MPSQSVPHPCWEYTVPLSLSSHQTLVFDQTPMSERAQSMDLILAPPLDKPPRAFRKELSGEMSEYDMTRHDERIILIDSHRDERRRSKALQTKQLWEAVAELKEANKQQQAERQQDRRELDEVRMQLEQLLRAQIGNSILNCTLQLFVEEVNVGLGKLGETERATYSSWSELSQKLWACYDKPKNPHESELARVSDVMDRRWGGKKGSGAYIRLIDRIRQSVRHESADRNSIAHPSLTPSNLVSYLKHPSLAPTDPAVLEGAQQYFLELTYKDEGKVKKVFEADE